MGTSELRKRENWQTESGSIALSAEKLFYQAMQHEFVGAGFHITEKPKELANIYKNVNLGKDVLGKIFKPEKDYGEHGIHPDFSIENVKSGKKIYVEIKRQDGWVEGKKPSAGRGNAHERLCKYFTPGLLKILRKFSKIGNESIPFWVVFVGDITRDPKRVREIHCWFDSCKDHFFLWQNAQDKASLIAHFNEHLRCLLV